MKKSIVLLLLVGGISTANAITVQNYLDLRAKERTGNKYASGLLEMWFSGYMNGITESSKVCMSDNLPSIEQARALTDTYIAFNKDRINEATRIIGWKPGTLPLGEIVFWALKEKYPCK